MVSTGATIRSFWKSPAGSLAAASRKSGRSHPTLFRRLNAIEHRLGTRLFDRQRNGYSLTRAGEAIVTAAKEFEALANSTERRLSDLDRRPSGLVTVTTTDALFHGLVVETLVRFRKTNPAISVEVRLSNDSTTSPYETPTLLYVRQVRLINIWSVAISAPFDRRSTRGRTRRTIPI